ncbi:TPA: hypothetical protein ACH3X2_008120 [Trebouxia sp. C0005]
MAFPTAVSFLLYVSVASTGQRGEGAFLRLRCSARPLLVPAAKWTSLEVAPSRQLLASLLPAPPRQDQVSPTGTALKSSLRGTGCSGCDDFAGAGVLAKLMFDPGIDILLNLFFALQYNCLKGDSW